jgi:hypothetical protein
LAEQLRSRFRRRPITKSGVWPHSIVVPPPILDGSTGVVKALKPVTVQALVSEPAVEGFNERILHRLPGTNEVEANPSQVRPRIEVIRRKLAPVVHLDHLRLATPRDHVFECFRHRSSRKTARHLHRQALPRKAVDHGQDTNPAFIGESIGDEVHRPALVHLAGTRRLDPNPARELLPTLDAHLEILLAVQAVDPLVVDPPTLPAEQDRQPAVAVARPARREIPELHP